MSMLGVKDCAVCDIAALKKRETPVAKASLTAMSKAP
jgi:hypothetical protein